MKKEEENNLPAEHADYHAYVDFRIDPEETRGNLEQIQDNSMAIGTIAQVLDFITLMQAKPHCETCGEWHDILAAPGVVGGLHQALTSISQYSDLLAGQAMIASEPCEDHEIHP